jgi:hypothetical protein
VSGGLKRACDFISTKLQIPVGRGGRQLMINAEAAYKEQTLDESVLFMEGYWLDRNNPPNLNLKALIRHRRNLDDQSSAHPQSPQR